jgi:hypothetical protein
LAARASFANGQEVNRPLAESLIRSVRLVRLRRRRRLRLRCLRCSAPAAAVCTACGARTCSACSVVSIETGTPLALCRSCSGGPSLPGPVRLGTGPRELLRSGTKLLLAGVAVTVVLAAFRDGVRGALRALATLLDPGVLFALGPLALVLGVFHRLGLSVLARVLRQPTEASGPTAGPPVRGSGYSPRSRRGS